MNGTAPITAGQVKDLGSALLQAIPTDMSSEIAQGWIGNKTGLQKVLREVLCPPTQLLEIVAETLVAGYDRFVAADHLKVDTSKRATLKIALLGNQLMANFRALVEEEVGNASITVHTLHKDWLDVPIVEALGENAEIKFGQFLDLLRRQSNGEPGPLLVNGHANIAYIRDVKGELWAVDARWSSRDCGWHVEANSVLSRFRWHAGSRVISH